MELRRQHSAPELRKKSRSKKSSRNINALLNASLRASNQRASNQRAANQRASNERAPIKKKGAKSAPTTKPTNSYTRKLEQHFKRRQMLNKRKIVEQKELEKTIGEIIHTDLIPYLDSIFVEYPNNPKIKYNETQHLHKSRIRLQIPMEIDDEGHTKTYTIGLPFNNIMIIEIIPKGIAIYFKNKRNPDGKNNISISFDNSKEKYMYGIKSNQHPILSGNFLNRLMFDIAHHMKIREVYISDAASVLCNWSSLTEILHFSILRVLADKPTFYESLPGHFVNPEEAEREKHIIQAEITPDEKGYIKHYLKFLKDSIDTGKDCDKINEIIRKALSRLPSKPELFKYIMTP